MIKISTWNVNSVRARMDSVLRFITENKIDILLMQEIKCMDDQFPYHEFADYGYSAIVKGQKARHGVAIISKYEMYNHETELPCYKIDENDIESRYIETILDIKNEVFKIANIYFPNGMPSSNYEGIATESERFLYKINFYDRMKIKMKESLCEDDIVIFGGDYNVMHNDIDVYNPKNWKGQIAFLPEERSRLSDIVDMGYTDAFRHFNPDMQEYTWWDYRSCGWQKNYGLRIDYMMVNQYGMSKLSNCNILRDTRGWERPSDHAPMICEFDI